MVQELEQFDRGRERPLISIPAPPPYPRIQLLHIISNHQSPTIDTKDNTSHPPGPLLAEEGGRKGDFLRLADAMGQGRRGEHRFQGGAKLVGHFSEPLGVLRSRGDRVDGAFVFSAEFTLLGERPILVSSRGM